MSTTTAYPWLTHEPAPRMLVEARSLLGVVEVPGIGDSPTILGWARELGLDRWYTHDETPWCGLFMALVAARAGKAPPDGKTWRDLLWARAWAAFGTPVATADAALGDVLVFARDSGGHVALYVGEDAEAYHGLAGNQGNAVSIARLPRARLLCVRRPVYQHGTPPNVRTIVLAPTGALSTTAAEA